MSKNEWDNLQRILDPELKKWIDKFSDAQKEEVKKLLFSGRMTLKSLEDVLREIEPISEIGKKELEDMGIKIEGIFQDIEPETLRIAKDYAEFYIKRYEDDGKKLKEEDPEKFARCVSDERYNPDGTLPEKRKEHQFRMGITQKAFEIALQQLQIPYIPNDPTIDWRPDQPYRRPSEHITKIRYDFWIPIIGKIDIKSTILGKRNVNINCREFESENPQIVVAYQILNMNNPKWLKLLGFMYNSEIREYSIKRELEPDRAYWGIPIEDFETKHNAKELCGVLSMVRNLIRWLGISPNRTEYT